MSLYGSQVNLRLPVVGISPWDLNDYFYVISTVSLHRLNINVADATSLVLAHFFMVCNELQTLNFYFLVACKNLLTDLYRIFATHLWKFVG